MNDEDFEKKLQALTGALHRPDPTPAWKADLLARARREAAEIPLKRTRPPRWLMLSWTAAWAAIALMSFSTPTTRERLSATDVATTHSPDKESRPPAFNSPQSLLAFQKHINNTLNNDFP